MFINFPEVNIPVKGLEGIRLPEMYTVKQVYDESHIADPAGVLREKMLKKIVDASAFKNKRICLTVGSRGIPELVPLVRAICDVLKKCGAKPFIVPAMGSHGGGTAEGQLGILHGYGVTEDSVGAPVYSSMQVVHYGDLPDGMPMYCDKYAWEADGIVVFNKVKPHTDFKAAHESGLAKMMAIGISKHEGAAACHARGFAKMQELIPQVAAAFTAAAPVLLGIGVVENSCERICNIEVCAGQEILETDAALLTIAKARLPRFKFKSCDVLIIDEIGKNISGNGYDPNIVGRGNSACYPEIFRMQNLFIRSISAESHGNGAGLACADITTRRCLNTVNWADTWVNIATVNRLNGGRIPVYANNDREALLLAIRVCDDIDYNRPRLVRIRNTLRLESIEVSEALYHDIKQKSDVITLGGPYNFAFDEAGFLDNFTI